MSGRCVLVYALAPGETSARAANDLLNEYVAERERGLAVWHDHFVGAHGGAVVLDFRSDEEEGSKTRGRSSAGSCRAIR